MTRCLVRLHRDERSALQRGSVACEDILNHFENFSGAQTLQSLPNCRRSTCSGDCQDRVKVRVQGHYNRILFQRECEYFLAGGLTHPGFPEVHTQLPDPAPGACASCRSGGVAFRRAVLKIGGRERQGLPDIVRFKLGISGRVRRGSDTLPRPPRHDAPSASYRGRTADRSSVSGSTLCDQRAASFLF
jgi:hypothetical protein